MPRYRYRFSAPGQPRQRPLLLQALAFVTEKSPRVKRRPRSYGSRSCALAAPPPHTHTHRLLVAALRPLSIFRRQQPSHTRDYLNQAGNLFLPPGAKKKKRKKKQPASSTPNKPRLPRAKRTPASDYQKDATPNPAYYFQFLLEKVNLMSIISS